MGTDDGWPREYEVCCAKGVKILYSAAFGCLLGGLVLMLCICSYPNTLSFVMGMLFLAYFCVIYFYVLRFLWHAKIAVRWPAFTVVPALREPKTYEITEITRVKYRRETRSGNIVGYKIFSGRERICRVDSSMVNCGVFISMLKEQGVPFI